MASGDGKSGVTYLKRAARDRAFGFSDGLYVCSVVADSARLSCWPSRRLLLRETTLHLIRRPELLGSERHRQELLECHDRRLTVSVVHQDGHTQLRHVNQGSDLSTGSTHTSQNSLKNCRHIPHGLAGGLMSVATATARMSPFLAPCRRPESVYAVATRQVLQHTWTTAVATVTRSAQVPTG